MAAMSGDEGLRNAVVGNNVRKHCSRKQCNGRLEKQPAEKLLDQLAEPTSRQR